MQIWQLFIVPRHPIFISVTVFSNYTLVGPTVTRPLQDPLAVLQPRQQTLRTVPNG